MRASASVAVATALLVAALSGGACNRGAAQESLRVAEEALEEARADLAQLAPGELEGLQQILDTAHVQLEEGRYTDALRAAQAFPARVRAARARVEHSRRELLSVWDGLSDRVPSSVRRLERRLALLAESWPGAVEARRALGEIRVGWTEARRKHEEGDMARAVAIGRNVEASLGTLAEEVNLLPIPRVATPAEPGEGS